MSGIRHVDIVVSSLERSIAFYRGVLGIIGWSDTTEISGEQGEPVHYLASPSGFSAGAIGLRQAPSRQKQKQHYRYDIGLHHAAFNAGSTAEVDSVAAWLGAHGETIESGPDHYYGGAYYAVFFRDPDGMKLEVVAGPETQ